MTSQAELDGIVSLFTIAPSDMPHISSPRSKPTYSSLRAFQDAINKNALCISSLQTELGHLALVLSPEEYKQATNDEDFVIPKNPGTSPRNPLQDIAASNGTPTVTYETTPGRSTRSRTAADATTLDELSETSEQAQTDEAKAIAMLPFTGPESLRLFNEQRQEFKTYQAAKIALRNLIINATEEQYIKKLKNSITAYATVTPHTLLEHLWTTYGKIDAADNKANEERMKAPWHPPTPIESLFKQLEDGKDFAEKGNESISDTQLIRWGYENIQNTGLFNADSKKWRKLSSSDQTWSFFKEYFTVCEDDRSKNLTAEDAHFTANAVHEMIQQELAAILCPPDQEQLSAPAPPASANASVTISDIKKIIEETLAAQDKPSRQPKDRTKAKKKDPVLRAQGLDDGVPVSYCWTHGITRNLHHTSKTCSRKAAGHKDEATLDNKLGGNTTKQQPRGE